MANKNDYIPGEIRGEIKTLYKELKLSPSKIASKLKTSETEVTRILTELGLLVS